MNRSARVFTLYFALVSSPSIGFSQQLEQDKHAKKKGITAESLRNLIGHDHRSHDLLAMREALEEDAFAVYRDNLGTVVFYHMWYSKGVELQFDLDGRVDSFFLYSGKLDNFKKYQHELPEKLSFEDKMDEVKRKLGPPEAVSKGGRGVPGALRYPSKGVAVYFSAADIAAGQGQPLYIVLFAPEKKNR